MELLKRELYLSQLRSKRNTPDIKIITGIRRSGKSKLMILYMDYLREINPKCNIIFIDFRQLEFDSLRDYHSLHTYVEEHYRAGCNNYLCIDEIQLCPNFERAIDSLHAKEKYDIYLTGSNAFMLSSDLATLFTGRYMEIEVYPFSYNEYCQYFHFDSSNQSHFDQYVLWGGFAGSYQYPEDSDKVIYVKDVYNTIIQRDLVDKYRIADGHILNRLVEFLMDNVGNVCSSNNITNLLNQNGVSVSHPTIGAYLEYLCRAFVFYKAKRYDIRGGKYLESMCKYYLADSGFRYSILGTRNMDYGRIYENIVFLELRRRGYEVYIGKLYQKEIDFVAMRHSEKLYIQVSDDISNADTFQREYTPLLQIRDASPKWIIARTRHDTYTYQGILIHDLATWLSQER